MVMGSRKPGFQRYLHRRLDRISFLCEWKALRELAIPSLPQRNRISYSYQCKVGHVDLRFFLYQPVAMEPHAIIKADPSVPYIGTISG
jgi:hypothetical protein